jgi:hypothetical protein
MDVPVRVVAGQETLLKVALVPNARHVVVRTDVPGVSDHGGRRFPSAPTALPEGTPGSAPAELLIDRRGHRRARDHAAEILLRAPRRARRSCASISRIARPSAWPW